MREFLKVILNNIDDIFKAIILLMSLLVIAAIVFDYGFVLDGAEMALIHNIYGIGWWVYFLSFTFQLIFHWSRIKKKALSLTTTLGIILYISALPHFFFCPEGYPVLTYIWGFLEHKFFIIGLLGIFSIIELSKGITCIVNKKTNPALLAVMCFAITIAFGALLLMLPRSTMEHIRLPLIDALFISTSAVCVTGLSTVEVAHTFTLEGQLILALLIQIGGLGIMTITSFFAIFFMDGIGLYSQFTLKDMISSNAESLFSTLLHVLGFTIVIELIGAAFIWISIHPMEGMTLNEEIFFSVFHSVSAFCNAGFSTLEGNLGNELVLFNHNFFYLVISMLIILGGIGFPILINLKRLFAYHWVKLVHLIRKKENTYTRYSHLANVNTKIVLVFSAVLILSGTFFIAIWEWNGALAAFSTDEKIVQSFFNAVVPRTAGFNSVAVSDFSRLTIIFTLLLMWIGGGSQSAAGGLKVNTLAVAFATIKSLVKGQHTTVLFNREITNNTIRGALSIIIGSIFVISLFFIALLLLEPNMSSKDLLFETVSAFSTVGSSMGITPHLSGASKFLLVLLMFIGRVGFITVLMSIIPRKEQPKYRLPKDNIIIN